MFSTACCGHEAAEEKNTGINREYNVLYQFGMANAFLGELYKCTLAIGDLKKRGDFGIGAPDMLDGELIMNNDKMYQTRFAWKTSAVPDSKRNPLDIPIGFIKNKTTIYQKGESSNFKKIMKVYNKKELLYVFLLMLTF